MTDVKLPPEPTLIASVSRASDSAAPTNDGIAFAADSLPPSGPVTLETTPSVPILAPSMLWVPKRLGVGLYHIFAYTTIDAGTAAQVALTAAVGSPVTVAAFDATSDGQIWRVIPAGKNAVVLANYGANDAAIKRSSTHPVPGAGLELGDPYGMDSHLHPYLFQLRPATD